MSAPMPPFDGGAGARQVGTVEILTLRVYPLDTNTAHSPTLTEVVVQPGVYPVYRGEYGETYWLLTGRINWGRHRRMGDGMFTLGAGDDASGPQVVFPSRVFGTEAFADLRAEPVCAEGDPRQRLRFNIEEDPA